MRFVLLIAALFLLLGCTQTAPANLSGNQTPPANPPPVQPPPALPPPVQPPPEPPPVSGNITDTMQNTSNQSNETVPQSKPKGLLFGDRKYLLVLDDVSVIPNSDEPCGIFSLRNATDYSTYEKMFICPPESQEWTSPDNHTYRIKVIKVAGYSGGANWVEVIIYG